MNSFKGPGSYAQITAGKSQGYWLEIVASRRREGWLETEAQQQNRFGKHWTEGIGRCRWGYTAAGYPRQRFGGYEFELPCLSRPEPRRWAERQPTTYPYKVLSIRETLSHILAPDLSDDRYSFDRLRDLRTHIAERARHSGALFQNKENPTKYQFARGIRWAELDGIEKHRRARRRTARLATQQKERSEHQFCASGDAHCRPLGSHHRAR